MLFLALWIPARAEPAFALRTGYRCSQCHVNRTGGGMRTAYGSIYTQTILPQHLLRWRDGDNLLPANPDARFAVGGDFRFQYLYLRSKELDDTSSFEIPEANLYLQGRLVPERLFLYLDGKVGPGGASARELFGLFGFAGEWRAYVKAGKFLPPFGWRLPDDDAFIRQFTGFTYSAPDTGFEIGAEPGRWSLSLAALNGAGGGSDDNRSKKLTLLAVRRFRNVRVGLSGSSNDAGATRETQAGVLAGGNWGRLALLGEVDWGEVRPEAGETAARLLALIEADLLILRGLNLKYAHDWIDPDRDVSTDDRVRDTLGIEYVPYPFIQLRLFAQRRDGPPQVSGAEDRAAFFELHLFF
jgi:hypothetical protein